jgi:hypothetical protein
MVIPLVLWNQPDLAIAHIPEVKLNVSSAVRLIDQAANPSPVQPVKSLGSNKNYNTTTTVVWDALHYTRPPSHNKRMGGSSIVSF